MKSLIFFLLLIIVTFNNILSQSCKIEVDEKTSNPMLIGKCSRDIFSTSDFSSWFSREYSEYNLKKDILSSIPDNFNDFKILIVMGTWCGDSRREVPRFYKIMDEIKFPDTSITLIAVNRKKQGLNNETDGLNIQLVPTMIFYKNGVETGRIIETPVNSLKEDIYNILTK